MAKLPIAKEGINLVTAVFVVGFVFLIIPNAFFNILGIITILFGLFSLYFFRDPERKIESEDSSNIISPGDGKIMEVVRDPDNTCGENTSIVKIFLSVFDVHVQRSPIRGVISQIEYKEGLFYDARDPRASTLNEQNSIIIQNENCKVIVKQIAGLIARRIICYVKKGQEISMGQRLGIIKFGSQVDLYLPKEAEICVKKGDRVHGAMSSIARLSHSVLNPEARQKKLDMSAS